MLFQFCIKTAILIKFTQDSNLLQKCLGNFYLKLQWWRAIFFVCLTDPCRELELPASSFNVMSLVWVLNLFGVQISNLWKLQQATIKEFLWKIPGEERTNFCVKWKPYRTIVDIYFDFLKSVIFFWNGFSILSFLSLEARVRELLLKNPVEYKIKALYI